MNYRISYIAFLTLGLVLLLPSIGCGDKKKPVTKNATKDLAIEKQSDLFLDSVAVISFFKTITVTDSVKRQAYLFYKQRGYRFAWLSTKGINVAATNFYTQIHNDSKYFADDDLTSFLLDSLIIKAKTSGSSSFSNTAQAQQVELLATTIFFKYAFKMYGGISNASKRLQWHIPRKPKNYIQFLDALSASAGSIPKEPVSSYYTRLKIKLLEFKNIEAKGGFALIKSTKKILAIGDTDLCLVQVKQHFLLTGYLAVSDTSTVFTNTLAAAVTQYQTSMGLVANGKINAATFRELNKPIAVLINQILINLERLRWLPEAMENDFLLVNIPEYKLHIVENSKQVWAANVVVGKAAKQTSIFRDDVSEIILNPYWNVPSSITNSEIIPHLNRNSAYLRNNNMEVVSQRPFTVRQKPGANNALGKMKFLFPNSYNIYLHDTPSKELFDATKRAFSHGCIRVENPLKLAQYLLRKDAAMPVAKIDSILTTNKEYSIKLNPVVPVYIVYFTAWVDGVGQLHFRNDLYNLDKKLLQEMAKL